MNERTVIPERQETSEMSSMNASAYYLETISRAQLREKEPSRVQQTILVEEMELRVGGETKADTVCRTECWRREGCTESLLEICGGCPSSIQQNTDQ